MNSNPSPLEYLASAAIMPAAKVIAAEALRAYSRWLQKRAANAKAD